MLAALVAGTAIVVAALLIGQAVMVACGRDGPSAIAPAAGFSALLVICGITVKLPGHVTTAAVAAVLAVLVAIAALARGPARGRELRLAPLVVAALAAVGAAVPFLAAGRVGILGQGLVNDDMASHLLFTEWLGNRAADVPDLVSDGYPLGPHAVVAVISRLTGSGLVETFAGLTGAIAALTALTAYGALRGVPAWLRVPSGALVALTYLAAAWLAQGAFKEPMLAMALIGFALCLPSLRAEWSVPVGGDGPDASGGGPPRRRLVVAAVPPGLIAAGMIYNYSFPGVAWPLMAVAAWALIAGRHQLRSRLRGARPAILTGAGLTVALSIPEVVRFASFANFEAFSPQGGGGERVGFGNLKQALNPLESLGVWPSSEFRVSPADSTTPELAFYLGGALAMAALGWGIWRAVKRREAALPAALGAVAGGYLIALALGTPYTQAKSLSIAAPVLMLVALRGVLRADPIYGEEEGAGAEPEVAFERSGLGRLALGGLAFAFIGAAALSGLLAMRQATVGPIEQIGQLRPFTEQIGRDDVLFLGRDSFVAWKLFGADVKAPVLNHYNVDEVASLYKPTSISAKFDFDSVTGAELDRYDWVVTTAAAQQSQPPPAFREALRTDGYILWKRTGSAAARHTLLEPAGPGAVVDCDEPEGRALTSLPGRATVFRELPRVARSWRPDPNPAPGAPSGEELLLPPGRYAISVQYAATEALHITGGGLDMELAPSLIFYGPAPFQPVGEIEVTEHGVIPFEASIDEPPALGRLVGSEARAYLGPIAATPIPASESRPLGAACGTYLDWFRLAPGTPDRALAAIKQPELQPIPED